MIRGFSDKRTEVIFHNRVPKGFPADILKSARRKLAMIDAAETLEDLRSPPGNRLEALRVIEPGSIRSALTTSGESVSYGLPTDRMR